MYMPADFRCMLNNSILIVVSVRVFYHGNQTVTVYPWASIGFTLSVMRKRFQRQRELIWEHQISNLIDNSIWSKNKMPSVAKVSNTKFVWFPRTRHRFRASCFQSWCWLHIVYGRGDAYMVRAASLPLQPWCPSLHASRGSQRKHWFLKKNSTTGLT